MWPQSAGSTPAPSTVTVWREPCEREEAEHQAQLTKLANAMNHSDKDLKIRELERQIALMEVTNYRPRLTLTLILPLALALSLNITPTPFHPISPPFHPTPNPNPDPNSD